MALTFTWLTPEFATAGQLSADDIAQAAAAGFRSVINNRPDFEGGPEQPTSASMEAAARAAGLRYEWLPVAPNAHSADEIARFAELLKTLPTPILAFCRSGARSSKLFSAAAAAPR
jgi:uncharacterized protein (TIGR01244 family)